MDLSFVRASLSAHQRRSKPAQVSESAWLADLDALMRTVQSRLDPIDVAFFEPLIQQRVTVCAQQSSMLLGALCSHSNSSPGTLSSSASTCTDNHSLLPLVKPMRRLRRLPVATVTPPAYLSGVRSVHGAPELSSSASGFTTTTGLSAASSVAGAEKPSDWSFMSRLSSFVGSAGTSTASAASPTTTSTSTANSATSAQGSGDSAPGHAKASDQKKRMWFL
jgi:hypothetical protein